MFIHWWVLIPLFIFYIKEINVYTLTRIDIMVMILCWILLSLIISCTFCLSLYSSFSFCLLFCLLLYSVIYYFSQNLRLECSVYVLFVLRRILFFESFAVKAKKLLKNYKNWNQIFWTPKHLRLHLKGLTDSKYKPKSSISSKICESREIILWLWKPYPNLAFLWSCDMKNAF